MRRFQNYQPKGVIPATLLAFNEDFAINERETRRHLAHVAANRGLSAITVNGHASEVHACSFAEQQRILELALDEVGDRLPLINGVYASGSIEAARIAQMADRTGASCLLVFPPDSMSMGGQLRPEMALAHFKRIADATDLPMILFQYPMASGLVLQPGFARCSACGGGGAVPCRAGATPSTGLKSWRRLLGGLPRSLGARSRVDAP